MNEFEKRVKEQWSKLSDADIEALRGHWDDLPVQIQRVYGYHWKEAEEAYQQFKATLQPEWDLNSEDRTSLDPKKGSAGDHLGDEHHSI